MPLALSAYIDESLRGSRYLLCAVLVEPSDAAGIRRSLEGLRRPGQRRIHMKHESDRRRREILSAVAEMTVEAHISEARISGRSVRAARNECLRALVPDLLRREVARFVLESCDQDHADNQVLRDTVHATTGATAISYAHARPALEPLLWLPDIIAWAVGRRGDWMRRTGTIVTCLTRSTL